MSDFSLCQSPSSNVISLTFTLILWDLCYLEIVPDIRSRDHEVVIVRRTINLGTGNLEWGGNGEGVRKGRSVYE
jgi:hypothetical protein